MWCFDCCFAFIHLTQSSSGVLLAYLRPPYMHTHTAHRRAPYSKHFYLCCSSVYDDYCLFLLYYYCPSVMRNRMKEKRKRERTRFMPFEYDMPVHSASDEYHQERGVYQQHKPTLFVLPFYFSLDSECCRFFCFFLFEYACRFQLGMSFLQIVC